MEKLIESIESRPLNSAAAAQELCLAAAREFRHLLSSFLIGIREFAEIGSPFL